MCIGVGMCLVCVVYMGVWAHCVYGCVRVSMCTCGCVYVFGCIVSMDVCVCILCVGVYVCVWVRVCISVGRA